MINPLVELGAPLTCPFLAILAALLLPPLLRRVKGNLWRVLAVLSGVTLFGAAYHVARLNASAARWLEAVSTPLVAAYLLVILPALYLPRRGWYRLFLAVPTVAVLLAVGAAFDAYGAVPEGKGGFYWLLIPSAYLLLGLVSLLVLMQPLMSLRKFRFAVRLSCFAVLVYGGFAFRQSYTDHQDMLERRLEAKPDIMNLSETSPVLPGDRRMLHLPSAPCRFPPDGGYVQGCNMEMLQRIMQVDFGAVGRRDAGEIGALAVLMGAAVLFLSLCFLAGRWLCGWVCPLSSAGSVLDWVRRKLRLPHLKPAQPVKVAYLLSGLSFAGIGLAMARLVPRLDADGQFAGCKIPLYPFCKICPSQQMCPMAASGWAGYPGLPTWEWGFGFFRVGVIALLALFAFSFVAGRRLWCRFCPMGMISGLFNRGGITTLTKDAQKCNRCGTCAEVCPMDIDLVRSEMQDPNVSSFDCVLCLKCVEKCPRDGCLSLMHAGARATESRFPRD